MGTTVLLLIGKSHNTGTDPGHTEAEAEQARWRMVTKALRGIITPEGPGAFHSGLLKSLEHKAPGAFVVGVKEPRFP